MSKKKSTKGLSPAQKKLAKKITRWAYTDSKKNPKKFSRLFNEIWGSYIERK